MTSRRRRISTIMRIRNEAAAAATAAGAAAAAPPTPPPPVIVLASLPRCFAILLSIVIMTSQGSWASSAFGTASSSSTSALPAGSFGLSGGRRRRRTSAMSIVDSCSSRSSSTSQQSTTIEDDAAAIQQQQHYEYAPPFHYHCEVVGASGRVGSFWLCHGADGGDGGDDDGVGVSSSATGTGTTAAAAMVPRGISPGCLTTAGCPIYVATPSSAWSNIWNETVEDRRADLVFVGNGLPLTDFQEIATIVVPHFAILKRCQRKDDDDDDDDDEGEGESSSSSCLQTSSTSPKTVLYGKHAVRTAAILQAHGVSTEIVESFSDITEAAARKLMWASCMWLLCRMDEKVEEEDGQRELTVAQVHEQRQSSLDALVDELYPALVQLVGEGRPVDRKTLDKYILDYSMSIPNAVPSKDLAMAEIEDRNGLWLSMETDETPQTFHRHLLRSIAGEEGLQRALSSSSSSSSSSNYQRGGGGSSASTKIKSVDERVGLVYWGEPRQQIVSPRIRHPEALKTVVIVGGGMIGSSLALALAERRPDLDITVLDQLPAAAGNKTSHIGRTTPASWAWLNANGKSPKSYQLLNQLGIHAWKREPHLSKLVSWMGSLVRFEDRPEFVKDGGYPAEGPLSQDRLLELEPLANWTLYDDTTANQETDDNKEPVSTTRSEGFTYFFPDEGCVDPMAAVETLRRAATERGVRFVQDANVTSVTRDAMTGKICGVNVVIQKKKQDDDEEEEEEVLNMAAGMVVVAAGAGSGAKGLSCGLQLLHRPGTLAFAKPSWEKEASASSPRLSRILVDPLRSSHVLQRPDGSIVAGGGSLEFGGAPASSSKEKTVSTTSTTKSNLIERTKDDDNSSFLLDGAKGLAPALLEGATLTHTCEAVRPMPQDGLPVVGYVADNLYAIVTHSGMTLGPLLASTAASEITEDISCDLLAPYRPSRFHE